jgi:hypothetical protein
MSAFDLEHDEEYYCDPDGRIYRLLTHEPWTELASEPEWTTVTRPKPSEPACYITGTRSPSCQITGTFPAIPDDDEKDEDYVAPTQEVGVRNQPWRQAKFNQ